MVQLIVGSKSPGPNFLTTDEAARHCMAGASVWPKYSTNEGKDPDVVIVGIGVETTTEAMHAVTVLEKEAPELQLKIRFVNIVDLLVLAEPGHHPHALDEDAFISLFTNDKPVVISFHGYPSAVQQLLFGRAQSVHRSRITVLGYREHGTTTSPFSMLRMNGVDRWSIAESAMRALSKSNPAKVSGHAHLFNSLMANHRREHEKYTEEFGGEKPSLLYKSLFTFAQLTLHLWPRACCSSSKTCKKCTKNRRDQSLSNRGEQSLFPLRESNSGDTSCPFTSKTSPILHTPLKKAQ